MTCVKGMVVGGGVPGWEGGGGGGVAEAFLM
jgi:hypothetical protein